MLPFENASKIVGILEDGFFYLLVTYSTKDTEAMREMLALALADPQDYYNPQPAEVVERNADHVVLKIDPQIQGL